MNSRCLEDLHQVSTCGQMSTGSLIVAGNLPWASTYFLKIKQKQHTWLSFQRYVLQQPVVDRHTPFHRLKAGQCVLQLTAPQRCRSSASLRSSLWLCWWPLLVLKLDSIRTLMSVAQTNTYLQHPVENFPPFPPPSPSSQQSSSLYLTKQPLLIQDSFL